MSNERGISKIILLAALFGVVLVLALGGWLLLRPGPDAAADAPGIPYKAGSYLTNLADTGARRYIKVAIQFEAADQATVRELDSKRVAVNDRILGILRSRTVDQLQGAEGMATLAADIVAGVNQLLEKGRIKELYFLEFMVQ